MTNTLRMPVPGFSSLRDDVSVESCFPPLRTTTKMREGTKKNHVQAADVIGLYRRTPRHICQSRVALLPVRLSDFPLLEVDRFKEKVKKQEKV